MRVNTHPGQTTYPEKQGFKLQPYPNCFGCGDGNAYGLRLDMKIDGDKLRADFTPAPHHQGWPGLVHGGVISALLYEVMENWTYLNGIVTMMRSMNARLRTPAKIGHPIFATSWLVSQEGREISVAAKLESDGKVIAEAHASLVKLDERRRRLTTEN